MEQLLSEKFASEGIQAGSPRQEVSGCNPSSRSQTTIASSFETPRADGTGRWLQCAKRAFDVTGRPGEAPDVPSPDLFPITLYYRLHGVCDAVAFCVAE